MKTVYELYEGLLKLSLYIDTAVIRAHFSRLSVLSDTKFYDEFVEIVLLSQV